MLGTSRPARRVSRVPYGVGATFLAGLVVYVLVRRLLTADWVNLSEVASTVLHRLVLIMWLTSVAVAYHFFRQPPRRAPAKDRPERELSAV